MGLNLCDRCAADCSHHRDPREIVVECGAYKPPMTNADRIRAMSDEDLAWTLMVWRCEAAARYHGIESVYPDTQQTVLKWLQQPAEGRLGQE